MKYLYILIIIISSFAKVSGQNCTSSDICDHHPSIVKNGSNAIITFSITHDNMSDDDFCYKIYT